jgi:hypothetical protein
MLVLSSSPCPAIYPKKPVNKRTTKIVINGLLVAALEKKFVKSFIEIKINIKNNLYGFIYVK